MNEAILAAATDLPERIFTDGEAVIVEGNAQHQILVLISGTVEVSRDGVAVSTITEPGAIFGELAALLKAPATASATARGVCSFRIAEDPDAFLSDQPAVALAVATTLAQRLDALTRYLVDIRTQYADRNDHLGIVDIVLEGIAHHQGAPPDPGSDRESEAPY